MSEELNKELETEVTEEVKRLPVETMEGLCGRTGGYKTLNQETHQRLPRRRRGEKWARFRSDDGGQDRCQS